MNTGITYTDHLIRKAHQRWGSYHHLPTDLHMEMVNAGLDVVQLERDFYETFHEGVQH